MARDESAREDLLREATALVERIELRAIGPASAVEGGATGSARAVEGSATGSASAVGALDHNVIVGFRPNGAASFFFGDDPVYQFNAAGELRRGFCNGLLFKAVRGRLVSLERQRQAGVVQLVSRELTDAEQSAFTATMQERLRGLAGVLQNGVYSVVGQVPWDGHVLGRVREWFSQHDGLPIARTARV